ncbi:MAG TPA: DUF5719 family protein, partial [Aquihabitans sp.]|nr:DUF5719 family protein [Aquihabitans sp.]
QADWVGAVVDVRGGRVAVDREVSGPLGYDAAPCATTAADRWYVPSGSTRRGSELYLSLTNPFPDAASVEVSFATDRGTRTPRSLRRFSVPGRSVRVVSVADLVTERAEVAATVRVRAGRVVVDRVQTSDGEGDPIPIEGTEATTPAPKGLVSTPASPVRAPRWIVPSARTGTGVRTQIAVANPSGRDARVDVLLRYQEPERYAELAPVELTVRAGGEEVVDLAAITDLAADANVWVDVRSLDEVPIVVERTTAYADPSQVRGVATALGSPAAATRWLVTQAGSSRSRNGAVLVTNPGARPAAIRAYSLESGVRRELPAASVTVPAGDRRSLDLSEAGAAASIIVEADTGVVVGSSLAVTSGPGVALQPGLPYPEDLVSIVAPG